MAIITGVGMSDHEDLPTAITDCLTQAELHLHQHKPSFLMAFVSSTAYDPYEVVNQIKKHHPRIPLIGCTSSGEITSAGSHEHSLVIAAVVCDKQTIVKTAFSGQVRQQPYQAGQQLADQFLTEAAPPQLLLVFAPGFGYDVDRLLEGLQNKLGPQTNIFGAMAADDYKFRQTYQFIDKHIDADHIVGIALYNEKLQISSASRHGWIPIGTSYHINKINNNLLEEINKRPAFTVYQDQFDITTLSQSDHSQNTSVLFPYPLANLNSSTPEPLLRPAVAISPSGELTLNGNLPNNSEVSLSIGNHEEALNATQSAIHSVANHLTITPPQLIITISNVSRKKLLMHRKHQEINYLTDTFGLSAPIVGFYSYGEFSMPDPNTKSVYQNASFAVICIST